MLGISCREMMPDPQFYKACLQEAFEELRSAAQLAANTAVKSKPARHGPRGSSRSNEFRQSPGCPACVHAASIAPPRSLARHDRSVIVASAVIVGVIGVVVAVIV